MKKVYQIEDVAYVVKHCPFWPSEAEKVAIEARGSQVIDEAESRIERTVIETLPAAIRFARKAVKGDFWGLVTVYEARLVNPYSDDIPNHRIKRSALEWEQIEGGYECEIER